jgi:hypothetical protein
MAVQVVTATVLLVPHFHRVVTEDDPLLADHHLMHTGVDGFEQVVTFEGRRLASDRSFVVVTEDQDFVAVQTAHDRPDLVVPDLHGEVTKVVDGVVRSYQAVPPLDQSLVHLICGTPWAVAEVNDVLVAEMRVGREEDRHSLNQYRRRASSLEACSSSPKDERRTLQVHRCTNRFQRHPFYVRCSLRNPW